MAAVAAGHGAADGLSLVSSTSPSAATASIEQHTPSPSPSPSPPLDGAEQPAAVIAVAAASASSGADASAIHTVVGAPVRELDPAAVPESETGNVNSNRPPLNPGRGARDRESDAPPPQTAAVSTVLSREQLLAARRAFFESKVDKEGTLAVAAVADVAGPSSFASSDPHRQSP